MEYLKFAQQNANPQVYGNKYVYQDAPLLLKHNQCSKGLTPKAENAFYQSMQHQNLLVNDNPQNNTQLGVSDPLTGYMPPIQLRYSQTPQMDLYAAQHNYQSRNPELEKHIQKLQNSIYLILFVFIVISMVIFFKMQNFYLKYKKELLKIQHSIKY